MLPAKKYAVNRRISIRRLFGIISIITLCLFLTSCATKAKKRQRVMGETFDKGDYHAIIDILKNKKTKKLYGETNAFLYHMDLGILYHYIGEYDTSSIHLKNAYDIYDELFTRSITNEAAALLTNDNVRPYRSKPYEIIMLHQLVSLNYMAQGNFEAALVESRRAQIHFNEWERTGAKSKKYHTDGMSHLFTSLAYESENERDNSLISLFKSIQAYKMGPVPLAKEVEGFAYHRLKAGDREQDVNLLNISSQSAVDNGWDTKHGESEIIIVAYAGRGPNLRGLKYHGTYTSNGMLFLSLPVKERGGHRSNVNIVAPVLPSGGHVSNLSITVSLPDLQTFQTRTSHFTARLDGSRRDFRSVVVNDFNLQAEKALDDSWSDIVARTVIRVVTRTIATQQAKRQAEKAGNIGMVLSVGAEIASYAMEEADTRMCFFLPQNMQVIRIPIDPGTHSVLLNVHDRLGGVMERRKYDNIEVKRGEKKVLFHKSIQ